MELVTAVKPRVFDIFNQFATDPKTELEGVWEVIGPALRMKADGVTPDPDSAPQVLVARAGNKRYQRMLVAEYEANKAVLDMKDDFAEKRNEQIMAGLGAKAILLGWKNLHYQGRELPDGWNYEDAYLLMSVKGFQELVGRIANNTSKYLVVQEAAAAKN